MARDKEGWKGENKNPFKGLAGTLKFIQVKKECHLRSTLARLQRHNIVVLRLKKSSKKCFECNPQIHQEVLK